MNAQFHKTFDKQFAKLTNKQKARVIKALELFFDNPVDPQLRNHPLTGEWAAYRSISAGGDMRLHYELIDAKVAYFVSVGTHSQLYR